MAQVTWVCNKDVRTARRQSDNLDQGAGASPALPFGYYSGYIYQALLGFSQNIDDYTIIDKAVLWVRTSDQYYVAFGSDPDMNIHLLNENWDEGDSVGLSTSNGDGPIYGQISVESSPVVTGDLTPSINTWDSFDITTLIQRAKELGDFKGLRLSGASTSSSDVGEIWAREKGTSYRAYIVVDYTNNRAPNAPTLTGPASGTKYASTTTAVTLTATASDPDAGDSVLNYDVQVARDSGFTDLAYNGVAIPSGISGMNLTRSTSGQFTHAPGTYYWRMRTKDAAGVVGPWSSSRTFVINALPVIASADRPYGGVNHVAPIHNLADRSVSSGALAPAPQFTFKPTAADGEAITAYEVEITGFPVETVTGSWASGTSIVHKSVRTLTNLSTYQVRFRARDAFEGYGAWSAYTTFAVKYAQAIYQYNIPGASGVSATLGAVTGGVAMAYRTATGASGAGAGAWSASPPSSVPAYLNVMVRVSSSGTAPVQPKLASLTISYYAATLLPYGWNVEGDDVGWGLDESMRKFGTKSLVGQGQVAGGSAQALVQQLIYGLTPETDYVASLWVHIEGHTSGGDIGLMVTRENFYSYGVKFLNADTDGWVRLVQPFRTDSGESVARLICYIAAGVATTTRVHFDGAMLSEGSVAPVWSPGLLGPVIADAKGIDVDGTGGGIFRLRGSSGGARDTVELGARGLLFGGTAHLYDGGSGELFLNNSGGNNILRLVGSAGEAATVYTAFLATRAGDAASRFVAGYAGDVQMTGIFLGDGTAARDTNLYRAGANQLATDDDFYVGAPGSTAPLRLTPSGAIVWKERSAMANAGPNEMYMWVQDNGSGKTQLCIRYNTGNIIVLNTQV